VINEKSTKKLIREYVSEVLKEYDDGSYGMDLSMYGMGGGVYGSGADLYNAFIKPFTDVIGTAVGKTKEVIRRGTTVLNVAFENLVTTLVPFLTDSYDEIFASEKADLQQIRSQYAEYYDATEKALGSTDAKMVAFLAFPGAALTGKFIKDAPDAAQAVLSVATGGLSDKLLSGRGGERSGKKGPSSVFDSYARAYSNLLQEAEGETKEKTLADKIGSKKFIDTLMNKVPTFKEAEKNAKEIFRKTLGERVKPILTILAADNIADLGKALGKPIKEPDMKELTADQKMSTQDAEKKFLEGAKKTSIKAAIKAIESYVEPARKAFGSDHPFVQSYDTVVDAIESGDAKKLEQIKNQLGIK
jgi:hypothetical protein